MLNPFKRKRAAAIQPTRADLQIRSLLDYPDLRRVMGLDIKAPTTPVTPVAPVVLEPRYDVRRLLEAAAV
jgi:hypothetical protein